MEPRKRVTEEDLRITETLIGKSYSHLKQLVIEAPDQAYRSINQIVREHPVATAGAAVISGAAIFGVIKTMQKPTIVGESPESMASMQNGPVSPDLMHEISGMILPLVVPYIMEFILKWKGVDRSE